MPAATTLAAVLLLLLLIAAVAPAGAGKVADEDLAERRALVEEAKKLVTRVNGRDLLIVDEDDQETMRKLQNMREPDFFNPNTDLCANGGEADENLGPCDTSRFPVCNTGKGEFICYNRAIGRFNFWPDHQPRFYIDYDRVFCYPAYLMSCSSCSPGRYCVEPIARCILDENGLPGEECARWY